MHTDFRYWLPFLTEDVPAALTTPESVARFELKQALPRIAPDMSVTLCRDDSMGEGFRVCRQGNTITITGGEVGLLYGA